MQERENIREKFKSEVIPSNPEPKIQARYTATRWCVNDKRQTEKARRLKVLLKAEVTGLALLLDRRRALLLLLVLSGASHDTSLLVVANTLLEEVGLASQRDVLHEVEGVGGVVHLGVAERQKQTVSDELNVLAHESCVHAEECARKGVREELLLNLDGLGDNGFDRIFAGACIEQREQEAGEVGVHALITRDELVGEGKTGHETTLLQPEDGSE
jgi:hypothetical protein